VDGPDLPSASEYRTPDLLITSPSIDRLGRAAVVSTRGRRSPRADVYRTQLQPCVQPSVSRVCCQIESSTSCFPGLHGRVVGGRPTSKLLCSYISPKIISVAKNIYQITTFLPANRYQEKTITTAGQQSKSRIPKVIFETCLCDFVGGYSGANDC
jgi:hypothetical protein